MPHRLPAVLASLALVAAGCGGSAGSDDAGAPQGDGGDARSAFASACGSCHTLAAAGTSGTFGPDLDELRPDRTRVLEAIESGPDAMPEDLLEGRAAERVAEFVASAAGG